MHPFTKLLVVLVHRSTTLVSKGHQASQAREFSNDSQIDDDGDEDQFVSLEEQKANMRIDFREVETVQAQPLHQTQSLNLQSMLDKALNQVSKLKQKRKGRQSDQRPRSKSADSLRKWKRDRA